MQNEQPLNFVNPKEINKEGILTYPPSEIDLRLKAISDWNKELLIRGPNQGMNHGSIYKQGAFLSEFKKRGGFAEWYKNQAKAINENKLREKTEEEANITTVNSAEYARRSAVASESSALSAKWAWIIAGIALLLSIVSFIISLLKS